MCGWVCGLSATEVDGVTGAKAGTNATVREKAKVKLTYKGTCELESLPKEIEDLEAEQISLATRMGQTECFGKPRKILKADQKQNEKIEALILEKDERWATLEGSVSGLRRSTELEALAIGTSRASTSKTELRTNAQFSYSALAFGAF